MPPAEQRRGYNYRSLERILCVLGLCPSVLVLFEQSSWLKKWACHRHDFFEAPSPAYAVPWSVGVGAAGAPVAIR